MRAISRLERPSGAAEARIDAIPVLFRKLLRTAQRSAGRRTPARTTPMPPGATDFVKGAAMRRAAITTPIALIIALVAGAAGADENSAPSWPDTFVGRLEALAILETLNADLLSHDSATLTLDRWCEDHRLAASAHIVAELIHGADKVASAEDRERLGVTPSEPVRYRKVRLSCGGHVLSEADNWYVPGRLTPEMNKVLDTTDTAFGRAVQALKFRRRTLSAKLLWSPLPAHWDMGAPIPQQQKEALAVPHAVLEHRAVLTLPDGTPFSQVVETYTSEVLAFPPPPAAPQ
jgi:chorismate-pyruvate lyase